MACVTLMHMGKQPSSDERIAALERRKLQIANRITRLRVVESTKERKRDTRRKILAGSWVLASAAQDPDAARRLTQGLDAFLTKPQDRAVFDLQPPKETAK